LLKKKLDGVKIAGKFGIVELSGDGKSSRFLNKTYNYDDLIYFRAADTPL
jgi:hypothetical protein